jgi:hypothetical protein
MISQKNVYIGNRYIPKICGVWDNTKNTEYESLSVVMWSGASYTSKQNVPQGIDIENTEFWAKSADYNAQMSLLQTNFDNFHTEYLTEIDTLGDSINAIESDKNILKANVGYVETYYQNGDSDDTLAINRCIAANDVVVFKQYKGYNISSQINVNAKTIIPNGCVFYAHGCNGFNLLSSNVIGTLAVIGDGYFLADNCVMGNVDGTLAASPSTFTGVQIGDAISSVIVNVNTKIDEIKVKGFNYGVKIDRAWNLKIKNIEAYHNKEGLYLTGIDVNNPLADIFIDNVLLYSNGRNLYANFLEFGSISNMQVMEHRNTLGAGVYLSNCKSLEINNLWLEFYNIPADLVGVGHPSSGINPNTITGAIKYHMHLATCSFVRIKNVYMHKHRLGIYAYFSGNCEFENVYDTSASGTTLTLNGTPYRATFIQYSWGNETYANTYKNCNAPIIANNFGTTQYQGSYSLVNSGGLEIVSNAKKINISGDKIVISSPTTTTGDVFATKITIKDGGVNLALPTYADNASAVGGGLSVGTMYKTASGVVQVVV